MKKRIGSLLLAAVTVLALCTSALAAPAPHWKVYVDRGSLHWVGSKAAGANAKAPFWQPAWLPEGWGLKYAATRDGMWPETNWVYLHGEETLSLSLCAPSDFSFQCWMDPGATDKTPKKAVQVQGYPASFWQVKQESALVWEDQGGNLFVLLHSGTLTQAELEKIANSVTELTEPMPEYQLGWAPDRELSRSASMPGYVRDFGGQPAYLSFTRARQPLAVPAGTAEAVTVQGLPARLWLGDPKATGTLASSAVTGKQTELPNEKTWSTLLWEDPETGLYFCLQGHKLSKAAMLRMAESAALKESAG